MSESITVIIPTTCEKKRKDSLLRAITSIHQQTAGNAAVLLVVNGDKFDPELFSTLQNRNDVYVTYQKEGNLPKALAHGRSLVKSDFFAFLDDDDQLLENALTKRLAAFTQNPHLDAVVTNGYNESRQQRITRVIHGNEINKDPLKALVTGNWLASCGGLFRRTTIGPEFFDRLIPYYEWTLIAFRLCTTRKMQFINEATYIVSDTANSLSKSMEYVLADETVLREMLNSKASATVRHALRKKMAATLHNISNLLHLRGQYWPAWQYHLASLCYPSGFRYLSYTRHLFFPARKQESDPE